MSDWVIVRHQVAIAGRVTEAQTGRAIAGVQVRITDAPPEFTDWLIARAKLVTLPQGPTHVLDAGAKLDDPGVSNREKLEAAQIILDHLERGTRRYATLKRPDRTRTEADGHFHFLDLPDGPYTLTASLPGTGTRHGTAQVEATVSRDTEGNITMAAADLDLPPTTITGQIIGQDTDPVVMAEVRVKGSSEHAFSNGQGTYRLTGLEATDKRERIVLISAQGYQSASRTVLLSQAGSVQTVNVALVSHGFNPRLITGCTLWLQADAITGLSDTDRVGTWPDSSGNDAHAVQTTESKQPTYNTNVINNKSVVRFDGIDASMTLSLPASATDHTFFFVYDQTPLGGHSNYLIDAEEGRLALDSASAASPYSVRWNDGIWHEVTHAEAGTQILTWRFAGITGEVFRNGASLGTATYTPRALGGRMSLGSNFQGYQSLFDGDMAEVIYYNHALSAAERQRVEQYLSGRYAIPLA